jgi:hypothetical protein
VYASAFGHGTDRSRVSLRSPHRLSGMSVGAIATAARNPDENAYRRSSGCGEIWNVARRAASSGGPRWR